MTLTVFTCVIAFVFMRHRVSKSFHPSPITTIRDDFVFRFVYGKTGLTWLSLTNYLRDADDCAILLTINQRRACSDELIWIPVIATALKQFVISLLNDFGRKKADCYDGSLQTSFLKAGQMTPTSRVSGGSVFCSPNSVSNSLIWRTETRQRQRRRRILLSFTPN